MSCSRTQQGDTCGDPTQDLSIQSQTIYHYPTTLSHFQDYFSSYELESVGGAKTGKPLGTPGSRTWLVSRALCGAGNNWTELKMNNNECL